MTIRLALLPLAAMALLTSCATPSATNLEFERAHSWRTDLAWQSSAKRIHIGDGTIYYHGTAVPTPAETDSHGSWTGSITGDILVNYPMRYITIPHGSLNVGPNNALSVKGPYHTTIIE